MKKSGIAKCIFGCLLIAAMMRISSSVYELSTSYTILLCTGVVLVATGIDDIITLFMNKPKNT